MYTYISMPQLKMTKEKKTLWFDGIVSCKTENEYNKNYCDDFLLVMLIFICDACSCDSRGDVAHKLDHSWCSKSR